MADFIASVAAMVGALLIADVIIHKAPAACHGIKTRYREKKQARKERRLLKKLEKQARRRNAAAGHDGAGAFVPDHETNNTNSCHGGAGRGNGTENSWCGAHLNGSP